MLAVEEGDMAKEEMHIIMEELPQAVEDGMDMVEMVFVLFNTTHKSFLRGL